MATKQQRDPMSVHPTKREAFEAMVNFLHTPLFEVRVRQIVAQVLAEQAKASDAPVQ